VLASTLADVGFETLEELRSGGRIPPESGDEDDDSEADSEPELAPCNGLS
jgi:hypothetical protein